MANLNGINNELKAEIEKGINSDNEAIIKAKLAALPKAEREKILKEVREQVRPQLSELLKQIESKNETINYSLDGIEEKSTSKLIENILGNPLMRTYFKSYGEKVLPKEIYNGPRETLEIVYFEKAISELNMKGFFKAGGNFLGATFSGLFSKNEKGESTLDFGALAKLSGDISGNSEGYEETKGIVSKAKELESTAKLKFINQYLQSVFKTYDENLGLLSNYKGKPGFQEVMNDPRVMTAVLNNGTFQEGGIRIDLKKGEFTYVVPSDIEAQRASYLQEVIAKIDKNGKNGEQLVSESEKYDGFFKLFDNGGIFGIIAKFVAEIFGFSADKTKEALDFVKGLMKSGDRDILVNNLRDFASGKGKEFITGSLPTKGKELKKFSKAISNITFKTSNTESKGAEAHPDFWSYIITGKGLDGKDISDISDDMKILRKIIETKIIAGQKPITGTDLVKGLNQLDEGSIQRYTDEEAKKKIEEEKRKEQLAEEEKRRASSVIPTTVPALATIVPENTGEKQSQNIESPAITQPKKEGTLTPLPAEVPTIPEKPNPFARFPVLGTVEGKEIRFNDEKNYIIIGENEYRVTDIFTIKDGEKSSRNQDIRLKTIATNNGVFNFTFDVSETAKIFMLGEKALGRIPKGQEGLYEEVTKSGTITLSLNSETMNPLIKEIITSEYGKGIYKNKEGTIEGIISRVV